jgi:hypothetical protein
MLLVSVEDFIGFHKLATVGADDDLIQVYIDRYEKQYIRQIFGVELGDLVIQAIEDATDSSPYETRFANIINEFVAQSDCSVIYDSKGLMDILMSMIFYHYVADTQIKSARAGITQNLAEVSIIQSPGNATRFAEKKWNDSMESVAAIQWRCVTETPADYPEYDGIKLKYKFNSIF